MILAFLAASVLQMPVEHTADTSNLIGIVSCWPKGSVLVYTNVLVSIDGDAVSAVQSWDKSSITIQDVFGRAFRIDLRKIGQRHRIVGTFNHKFLSVKSKFEALTDEVVPEEIRLPSNLTTMQIQGIGHPKRHDRFFEVWRDDSYVYARRRLTEPQEILRLQKFSDFIYIESKSHFLYLECENGRAGNLVWRSGKKEFVIRNDAQRYFPLRLSRG